MIHAARHDARRAMLAASASILAIDPGCAAKPTLKNPRPGCALHGWCIVRILPGLRPEWMVCGHTEA